MRDAWQICKIYKAVGKSIAEARETGTRPSTQEELAAQSKGLLSRSTIANIESGRQRLAVHQLYIIARVLNIPPARLLPDLNELGIEDSTETLMPGDPGEREWLQRVIQRRKNTKKQC